MKKLLLLLFSLMLSFNSYGEWTLIHTDDDETYIDLNTIKKHNEFIYWWAMFEDEGMSVKTYLQGDCGITRLKNLTMLSYNQPMGKGEADTRTFDNPEWSYQPPDSVAGFLLDTSCRLVEASPKEQQEIIEEIQSKEELQRLLRIDEAKAKAKEDLAQELELRLLELKKLAQEEKQELNELTEFKAEFEKDELLLRLLELEKLVQAEKQELNDLVALRASTQEAFKKEQYNRLLTQEVQAEQDTTRSIIIEDQLNRLKSSYVNNIASKVRNLWRYQFAESHWTAEVYVVQDRDGNVKAVDVKNSNVGNSSIAKSFMDSIERAVYKASPFPAAPDDAVFDRELFIKFSVN